MSANIVEQTKEIGILRAIGFTKYRLYWLYFYESFILVFSSCFMGIIIGTIIGWTMLIQRVLFTGIPMAFFFPYIPTALVFMISIVISFLAVLAPTRMILSKPIA